MLPSECVLERRVRSYGDEDLADKNLRLFILECRDRKAEGFPADQIETYNQRLMDMKIGRLADHPPAVSYLAILCHHVFGEIVAVDKAVIVARLGFAGEGGRSRTSYLIYDARAMSLRMIPLPKSPDWIYSCSSKVSIARNGDAYALLQTALLPGAAVDEAAGDAIFMWRPSSSSPSSPPWLFDYKVCSFPDLAVDRADTHFSFNGSAYWVDLLYGVSYCTCEPLFDNNNTSLAEFGFFPLPVEDTGDVRSNHRVAEPLAYRNMGAVGNAIGFVSINGFQNHVKLKYRTITVWRLVDREHDEPWVVEHELSMQTLWGFEGFGNLPKHLTPMYPILSTKDRDLVYLVLGKCCENPSKGKFIPNNACHMLAVDMRNRTVKSLPLSRSDPDIFFSCDISSSFREALVGPCDNMMESPWRAQRGRISGKL